MNIKLLNRILYCFIILVFSVCPLIAQAKNGAVNAGNPEKIKKYMDDRVSFLLSEARSLLKKANWTMIADGDRIIAYRLEDRYDEMSVRIKPGYSDGLYAFTVEINKNCKEYSKTFSLPEIVVSDDYRLKDVVLSFLVPHAVEREGVGDFRKAYSSVFSFGYSRTHDGSEFYPAYAKGKLHLSWELVYDPSKRIMESEKQLTFGNYTSISAYVDWASYIHENFFNIDVMIFGKNKYTGTQQQGTRLMYGFFNGLEYFRPGFSDSAMKWDRKIYETEPFIQYMIWRALQGMMIYSRQSGDTVYSAEFMIGAGMGVGPSSLFLSELTEEDEQNMSDSFRSIKYRKQNYYFSYSFPVRLLLCADRVHGFRFEAGYNYYFFIPVIRDNLYDMLHIARASVGYYLDPDVLLNVRYERWFIESMLHDETRTHGWNRLIIELRNYF